MFVCMWVLLLLSGGDRKLVHGPQREKDGHMVHWCFCSDVSHFAEKLPGVGKPPVIVDLYRSKHHSY